MSGLEIDWGTLVIVSAMGATALLLALLQDHLDARRQRARWRSRPWS